MTRSNPRRLHGAAALALLLVLALAGSASAQTLAQREATGEAPAADGARERALDLAFANAIRGLLTEELPRAELRQHRAAIEDKVVRRARLYVKSFRVLGSQEVEGRLMVRIEASVDRDALRAALSELGASVGDRLPPRRSAGTRPSVLVILHAQEPSADGISIETTFGARGGVGGAAGKVLSGQLTAMGFDLASAAGVDAPTSVGSPGDLPMGDAAAMALARQVGAGGVVIIGLVTDPATPIRATRKQGAVSRLAMRALDAASGKVIVSARLDGAGFGDDRRQAEVAAAREAGHLSGQRAGAALAAHWPADLPASIERGTLLVIRGASRWASIEAIGNAARTVTRAAGVTLRWFRNGEVAMVVDTQMPAADIANRLRGVTLPLGSLTTRVRGSRVEVEVDGDREGVD
ncbi:MAG TPA: hypothetical protein VML75_20530 [Kofleriaceae bacterium]|nr:hypothetical protein [Kofleriaceae bacterium]